MRQLEALTRARLRDLACRQLADYDAHRPGTLFASHDPVRCVRDAYRLQIATARLREARGEQVAGYKIGCISRSIQRQLGIGHPVFGHVFQIELRSSPASLEESDFCRPAIEGEFAAVLVRDITDPSEVSSHPEQFVAKAVPVIELHNYVFRGEGPSASELISNNALHAGVVAASDSCTIPFSEKAELRVTIPGRVDDAATTCPVGSLGTLVGLLADHGIRPKAGDILLTGSPLPLYPVRSGDSVEVSCGGTSVRARFT